MPNSSVSVVPRSVHAWTNRARALCLMAALCVLAAAAPSQAAGCHVQDRPLLRFALSWEIEQTTARSASELRSAPPVLSRLPCGSEVPFVSSSSALPADAALVESLTIALPAHSGPSLARVCIDHSQPPSLRLDRPPREIDRCELDADLNGAEVTQSWRGYGSRVHCAVQVSLHSWGCCQAASRKRRSTARESQFRPRSLGMKRTGPRGWSLERRWQPGQVQINRHWYSIERSGCRELRQKCSPKPWEIVSKTCRA